MAQAVVWSMALSPKSGSSGGRYSWACLTNGNLSAGDWEAQFQRELASQAGWSAEQDSRRIGVDAVSTCPVCKSLTALAEEATFPSMSAQEIIAELARLKPDELQRVKEKLHELENAACPEARSGWGQALLEIAGTADDLPADFSANHDHYLYGAAKRE